MARTRVKKEPVLKEFSSNKWSRQRRIEFIDFRLCVDGRLNRSDLVDFFGISIPQASLDLTYYRALVKNAKPPRENLFYDVHQKEYIRTDDFKPVYPEQCSVPYFFNDLMLAASGELPKSRNFFSIAPDVGIACLTPPKRMVSEKVLTNLLDAIRSHLAMHIVYKSLSNEKDSDYLIAPHSFAFDGVRWHVRAYCYDKHDFRDYVLSRIKNADRPRIAAPSDRFPDPIGNGFREIGTAGKDDRLWNETVTLELRPNHELPEESRLAIELDYCVGKDGIIKHTVKKALLFYAVRSLKLTDEYAKLPIQERQLELINKDEVFKVLDEVTHKQYNIHRRIKILRSPAVLDTQGIFYA